ncbi:hypothetical protein R3P38DRAFT_2805166 [Favolaschia claudopus]|uniref:Uncharacterized protein n=1 Tax=Favolaschia claudopus TaxID=2862362 RepID=A0AAV9ZNK9_9AGAR
MTQDCIQNHTLVRFTTNRMLSRNHLQLVQGQKQKSTGNGSMTVNRANYMGIGGNLSWKIVTYFIVEDGGQSMRRKKRLRENDSSSAEPAKHNLLGISMTGCITYICCDEGQQRRLSSGCPDIMCPGNVSRGLEATIAIRIISSCLILLLKYFYPVAGFQWIQIVTVLHVLSARGLRTLNRMEFIACLPGFDWFGKSLGWPRETTKPSRIILIELERVKQEYAGKN